MECITAEIIEYIADSSTKSLSLAYTSSDSWLSDLIAVLRHPPSKWRSPWILDIGGCQMDERAAVTFAIDVIPHLTDLRELDLRDNRIGTGSFITLAQYLLAYCPKLTKLDLSENIIRDASAKGLEKLLMGLPHLQKLDIGTNQLSSRAMPSLTSGIIASNLKYLGIQYNSLGDAGVKVFCNAIMQSGKAINMKLRKINLSDNSIGDSGVAALVSAIKSGNLSLTHLDVSVNKIQDRGASELATLIEDSPENRSGTSLSVLDIGCNPIGDNGNRALINALRTSSTLALLDLTSCWISEELGWLLANVLEEENKGVMVRIYNNEDITPDASVRIFRELNNRDENGFPKPPQSRLPLVVAASTVACLLLIVVAYVGRQINRE